MGRFSAIARMAILLVFALALGSVVAFGQQVTGTILGRVTDSSGSVVPGATIQIQNPATGFSRTDTADTDGRYYDANLPLGAYTVTITKQGFETLVRSGIELTVGSELTVNAELVVGNVQQHVEVTGEAPQIETSNATISGLVSQDQLRDLPLNGRSIDTLALLSPGIFANRATSANTTVGLGLHLTVNGARQDWNVYLLDGTVVNDVQSGRSSATGEALGVEGILEFRIFTHGASAEYGRSAGGVISEVTRSGTNQFHGSAYEFVRNTIFNAQNDFSPSASIYKRNQFGGAVGGPIFKNKLFFFANYEGLRSRQAVPVTSTVPDDNAKMGIIPGVSTAANPIMVANAIIPYLALYPPCGNSHNNGDGTCNVVTNFSQPAREDYTMTRLDYKISDKDSFYARYVYDPSTITTPDPIPTSVLTITGFDRLLGMSETHIFSPTTLNEFRFAVNRTAPSQFSYGVPPINPALSFVPGQPFGSIGLSTTTNGGASLSSLGTNKSPYEVFAQNLIVENDTVTTVRGAHTIKFGVDVEREQINMATGNPQAGGYTFGSLPLLLQAMPKQYQQTVFSATSTPQRGWRRILFGAFVQDDIRVRPNLTVNLGLRYEFFSNPSEIHGLSVALINVTDPSNTPGPPFTTPKLNFSPRVGLAWDPTGSGKTSIRLGGGIYDNEITGRSWIQNATSNASFLKTYVISSSTNNVPFPNGLSGSNTVGALNNEQVQYHTQMPTVYQWNLEVQRQLAPTLSLRAGYVGSRGVHLPSQIEADTTVPTSIVNGIPIYPASGGTTVNPAFSTIGETVTNANSNYNALQLLLAKTVSAGLSFQASYTYSHAQAEADQIVSGQTQSGPGSVEDPYNIAQDYSDSAFDQRQTFVLNGAYQMPWDHMLTNGVAKAVLGGWSINGIFTHGTGLPFTILDGFNLSNNGDSNNTDRPNLLPGFSRNPTSGVTAGCGSIPQGQQLHTATRWFDPCAFSVTTVTPGTYGNLGRNSVIGPGLSTLDFTLVKLTNITEKTKLEFRAECFNLMNHPNFGLPKGTISSSSLKYSGSAGQITSTSVDNRELQLGMKFIF